MVRVSVVGLPLPCFEFYKRGNWDPNHISLPLCCWNDIQLLVPLSEEWWCPPSCLLWLGSLLGVTSSCLQMDCLTSCQCLAMECLPVRGVIFAQTQTSDSGVCHLRLVGVVVQRDVNKNKPFPSLNYAQLLINIEILTFKHKKQAKITSKWLIK